MKKTNIALTTTRLLPAGALALTLALAGCSTTTEQPTETDSGSKTGSEFSQGETPTREPDTSSSKSAEFGTAYFDFDRSEIRSDMRDVLKKNATKLEAASGVTIIGGHADERGSEEYNLALGERRGESVKRYLAALGVSSSSMKVVSYGEARPAVVGHDESAWRWNRRAEFAPQ